MGDRQRIELARDGRVTWRNHARRGYVRLTRGVYGPEGASEPKARWWVLVRGAMAA